MDDNISDISYLHLGDTKYNYDKRINDEFKNIEQMINSVKYKKNENLRKTLGITLLLLVFLQAQFGFLYKQHEINCYDDVLHNLFEPLNKVLKENQTVHYIIFMVFGLICDLTFIFVSIIWFLYSSKKNNRFVYSILTYSTIGIFSNYLLEVNPSIDNIWEYPGIPSFVLNYTSSNYSLIYPIDIGIMLICYFELQNTDFKHLDYIIVIVIIILCLLRLICQASYTPGIIISLIMADFIYINMK